MATARKESPRSIRLTSALLFVVLAFTAGIVLGSLIPGQSPLPTVAAVQPDGENPHVRSAEQLTQKQPGNPKAWVHLGDAYFDASRPEKAIQAYERALELDPDDVNVRTDLGTAYRLTGQPRQAIAQYDAVLAFKPRHENARLNKGIVLYFDLGQQEEALTVWNTLLSLNPDARGPNNMSLKEFLARLAGG